jgi:hypothetical protein
MSVLTSGVSSPSADEVAFLEAPAYPRVIRPRMPRHRLNRLAFGPFIRAIVALPYPHRADLRQHQAHVIRKSEWIESAGLRFDGARLEEGRDSNRGKRH